MRRPIDLEAVRVAIAGLREDVRRYPALTLPDSQARAANWLADQEREPVKKLDPVGSVQLNFRAPRALVESLERERARLSSVTPGLALSTSDTVRVLLARALAASPAPKRKTAARR